MKKIEVMPKVVIYQDAIPNISEILEVVKKSETDVSNLYKANSNNSISKNDHGLESIPYEAPHVIKKWVPWYEFGEMSNFVFNYLNEDLNQDLNEQKNILIELIHVIKNIFDDYAQDWADSDWPEYVLNWTLSTSLDDSFNKDNMMFADLAILKHYVDKNKDVAIPLHTDFHNHTQGSPGEKPIITITIYLNDDYDGGEIKFINTDSNESVVYKPKAGDITVFPSVKPYWHAALPVGKNNKYLLRSFISYYYDGSDSWKELTKKYSNEELNKLEKERIEAEVSMGLHALKAVYDKDYVKLHENEQIVLIEKENYIDGRNL